MTIPPSTDAAVSEELARRADQRRRLLRGIGSAMAAKGYTATTIADIVRDAHVSKRTFYEHFEDKLDCFLDAYRMGYDLLLRRMTAGAVDVDPPTPPLERLRAAVRAYLAVLAETPAPTRTFTLEIDAAGPRATAMRHEMHHRTATRLAEIVEDVRAGHPELRPLNPTMAAATVGAMTELVMIAVTDGRIGDVADLDRPVTELIQAILTAPHLSGRYAARSINDQGTPR